MKFFYKINKFITKIEEFIIASSVIVMSLTLVLNVFGRMFFKKGIYATEEIGSYCIYLITFIGLSYAVTTGKHINMLGLFDMLPKKFQKFGALLISAVTGLTMVLLSFISFKYVNTLRLMGKVSINLRIPTYLVVTVISFGFLFAAFGYMLIFIKNLQSDELYLGLDEIYVSDFIKEAK